MKPTKYIFRTVLALTAAAASVSCDDYLDKEPKYQLSPESYYTDVAHLQASADNLYTSILPSNSGGSYGIYASDQGTDNQIGVSAPGAFDKGEWKVPLNSGSWSFSTIYHLNFFFENVLPKFGDDLSGAKNTIKGDLQSIRHYIGEMYFFRALEYFKKLKAMGDYPIITTSLPDQMGPLTVASKRSPRNEVARFILSDLDKAITLMDGKDFANTRINRDAALLIKSRVALFEGTWLKYFKGTPFAPLGEGWPGKNKDYNAGYSYPSGSIDNEISFFLNEAVTAAKKVGDKYKDRLTSNTGTLIQNVSDPVNPFFEMFGCEDPSGYKEVLLWRQYVSGLNGHDLCMASDQGNWGVGMTRGYVQNFLMADGLPVYAHGTYADGDGYYKGDKTIADVRANRDTRLSLFLKEYGQKNVVVESVAGITNIWNEEPVPDITTGVTQQKYTTGYALRKGGAWDNKYMVLNKNYTSVVYYRSVEAMLNYMEASYELKGNLDATSQEYWRLIRQRALVSDDFNATIAATDMNEEAKNDWGAYSGGVLLTDKTLYNIRRERRCELISEGFRYDDLRRWRAMDQLITNPYIPEGFHLWNTPMQEWYVTNGKPILKYGQGKDSNVSSPEESEYLRPYRVIPNQRCADGFTWSMAHYLDPIRIDQFQITAPDGHTVEDSPIYQNPYWPTTPNLPAEK